MSNDKITTIQLGMETRQLLRKIGRKEQTYDALIKELIAMREKCEEKEDLPAVELRPPQPSKPPSSKTSRKDRHHKRSNDAGHGITHRDA